MPNLHINADDFGLHADIDRGILDCVDARRVTGISVAANGEAIDWLLVRELARRVQAGVHVTLVGERWLTRDLRIESWSSLVPWLILPGRLKLVAEEIKVQVQTFHERGGVPAMHIDSHQHVHVMPRLWPIFQRAADAFSIPRIRVPATPAATLAKPTVAGQVLQRLAAVRRSRGSMSCIGIARSGHNTVACLEGELAASGGMDVELVAHPGIDTPALQARYAGWRFDWKTEQAALLSDAWGEAIARHGYRIAAPRA